MKKIIGKRKVKHTKEGNIETVLMEYKIEDIQDILKRPLVYDPKYLSLLNKPYKYDYTKNHHSSVLDPDEDDYDYPDVLDSTVYHCLMCKKAFNTYYKTQMVDIVETLYKANLLKLKLCMGCWKANKIMPPTTKELQNHIKVQITRINRYFKRHKDIAEHFTVVNFEIKSVKYGCR